ncbi:MAG: acetyl esterase [Opitutaceae bacterium]|nr:acetyl esterase [Opitutaceae bacterium]
MVLEKAAKVSIWGSGDPGEEVTVSLNGIAATAKADAAGKWMLALNLADSAPGPFEMTVAGKNKLTLSDVVIGEVWVASGQSNMQFMVREAIEAEGEMARPANPLLRQFAVKMNATSELMDDVQGKWVSASPATAGNFTAVGYFFAKMLQKELSVPVGLIHISVGGTPCESWTSAEALDSVPDLRATRERLWAAVKEAPEKKKAFIESMEAWTKENGREDKPCADAAAYTGPEISSDGWVAVKLPGAVTAPVLPQAGAVWLRKEINFPSAPTEKFPISLPIDGFDSVYWNGRLLKQTTFRNFEGLGFVRRRGPFDIMPEDVKVGKNILAIRLYEPTRPAVFPADTGGPRAGSGGSIKLEGEWLAKTEYEFPAIPAEKLAAAPQPLVIPPSPIHVASFLFNGMVRPIIPYAIRGVIWYQGEANTSRAYQYRTTFPLLISDWRKQWNQGDFPFYFCQLPIYRPKASMPGESGWAELREAQSLALKLPNVGQAVTIDVGETGNLHPRNKKDVGERLALIALAKDYGKAIPFSGPIYDSMKVESGKAILSFLHTDGGLTAKPLPETDVVSSLTNETATLVRNSPNSQLEGFAICGEDRKWIWSDAKIDGDNVIVWSDKVPSPLAVRYAWADNPTCNLTNGSGLPASPFRTDDFPPVTLKGRY